MLNRNKILMLAVVGTIANLPAGATAQTFYQCKPKACNDGEYFNGTGCTKLPVTCSKDEILSGGKCYSTSNSGNWTLVYDKTSGEGSATLSAGTYIVSLHGGNGGNLQAGSGPRGGTVNYQFTMDKAWTFKYGVGRSAQSGGAKRDICSYQYGKCTGGGGGSWISIDNQYIVAGGGGGFSSVYCKGGYGGAIGAGSNTISYYAYSNCTGGDGGNYSAFGDQKEMYAGTTGAEGSEEDISYVCQESTGLNEYNKVKCNILGKVYSNQGAEIVYTPATVGGVVIYPGGTNTQVGGYPGENGSATHASNTSAVSGCGTSDGCVKLYKFKY